MRAGRIRRPNPARCATNSAGKRRLEPGRPCSDPAIGAPGSAALRRFAHSLRQIITISTSVILQCCAVILTTGAATRADSAPRRKPGAESGKRGL